MKEKKKIDQKNFLKKIKSKPNKVIVCLPVELSLSQKGGKAVALVFFFFFL
jgi:hypothetical protein